MVRAIWVVLSMRWLLVLAALLAEPEPVGELILARTKATTDGRNRNVHVFVVGGDELAVRWAA